jgi:hypothetical protein
MTVTEADIIAIPLTPSMVQRARERAEKKKNHVDTWLERTAEESKTPLKRYSPEVVVC